MTHLSRIVKKDLVGKLQKITFAVPFKGILRGGAVVARRAHNPKVIGSNPVPATKNKSLVRSAGLFLLYRAPSLLECEGIEEKAREAKLPGFCSLLSPPFQDQRAERVNLGLLDY